MANELTTRQSFSVQIQQDGVQKALTAAIGDPKRRERLQQNLIIMAANDPKIAECKAIDVIKPALYAESLNLSILPQLGQAYVVIRWSRDGNKPALQLGYKGYETLASRCKTFSRAPRVVEIKEGELIHYDPIRGNYDFVAIDDPVRRELAKTIGYFGTATVTDTGEVYEEYWTKQQIEAHAARYSEGYKYDKKNGKTSTPWSTNFDAMAKKTVILSIIRRFPSDINILSAIEAEAANEYQLDENEYKEAPLKTQSRMSGEPARVEIDTPTVAPQGENAESDGDFVNSSSPSEEINLDEI